MPRGRTTAMLKQVPELPAADAAAEFRAALAGQQFGTILADPPWRFTNRTGKMAPEHRRLSRYGTMTLEEICKLPVAEVVADKSPLIFGCRTRCCPRASRC